MRVYIKTYRNQFNFILFLKLLTRYWRISIWGDARINGKYDREMPLNCGAGEDSSKSLGQQGNQTSQSQEKPALNAHQKDCCLSWSSSILVIRRAQLTYWKRPWCWERLRAEEEGIRGWEGCMASLMQWTWTWANFGRWWGTGKPGELQSMGSQRMGHTWAAEQQHDREVVVERWRKGKKKRKNIMSFFQTLKKKKPVEKFLSLMKWALYI